MDRISQNVVVDGYKLDHITQYVDGTEGVMANMTPRSDRLANVHRVHFDGKVVNFGIQYALKVMQDRWDATFFSKPRAKVLAKYARRIRNYVGPDKGKTMIEAMGKLHDEGILPIEVRALPEGAKVNMQVPLFVVRSTKKEFYWLTNYLETYLSCMVWPMCNAATVSEQYWKTSKHFADLAKAPDTWLAIANHCFAARGHRGQEDAMISGMGQLVFSVGTDTLWAIDGHEEYYNANSDEEMIGVSVNAFEHATATQRIAYYRKNLGFNEYPLQAEEESLKDIYTRMYPTGIVSYVADSEDYYGLMEHVLPKLKEQILARTEDAWGLCKAVFRPDSSPKTPFEVILGDPEGETEAERRGSLQLLWDTFGGTISEAGLKQINPKVGLIYGEAIDMAMQWKILQAMVDQGWCVSNILMGTGSWGFLKDSSRDSWSFAIKGTHSIVNGEGVSMQKNPKTAQGSKKSACGLLRVEREGNDYVLYDNQTEEQYLTGELKLIWRNSEFVQETCLTEIRELAQNQ